MSTTIEQLELEVQSNATSAVSGVDALASSLGKLKAAVKGGVGLTAVAKQFTTLNNALNGVSGANAENLNKLAQGLQTLSTCGNLKLSSSVATQITNIGSAVRSLDNTNFTAVRELASAIAPLSQIGKANLNSFISQLQRLPQAVQALNSVNVGSLSTNIRELVSALTPLTQMGRNNLTSFVTQLQRLPQAMAALQSVNMGQLAAQIRQVANAFAPLATQMQSIANGFSAMPTRLQRLIQQTNSLSNANSAAGKSYVGLAAKAGIAYVAMKRIASVIAGWITKSNDYVESLNLFTVSMGEYADQAKRFAESVTEVVGIDPAEWMKNQGVFMTLASGFGVMSDRAYTMSQNLTQLGYDLSSFFNISYEDAFQKLQSGISGELEPLRRLGFDLSVARLQQEALNLGIQKSVNAMTQAEKAELRYYAIMTQVTTAQGDMARTLEAPANQLRILQAQVNQAARALGNIFIPILNAVLPYAIALAKAVRLVADAIAQLFGFTIPEMNWDSITGGVGDVSGGVGDLEDNLGGAGDKAKELKNALLGIDELNVISPNEDLSSGGTDGSVGGGGGLDFELPTYDFIGDAVSTKVDEIMEKLQPMIEWIKTHLDDILDVVLAVGAGFLTWKFANGFTNMIEAIENGGLNKVALGLTLMVTGITLAFSGAYDIGYEGASWENILKTAIGDALIVGGSLLTFGTGPVGWIVGIGIALVATITGIVIGANDRAIAEDLKNRFGELILSSEEITTIVKATLNNDWYSDVQLYLDVKANLDELRTQIEGKVQELNRYSWKVRLGLELSESEMSSYRSVINDYVESANKYIADRGYVISVGIKATLEEGEIADSILASNAAITELVSDDLASLGTELQSFLNEAFSDGILTIDEQAAIDALTNQINNVLEIVSQSEFEAKLDVIDLKYGMAGLSQESWEAYKEEVQGVADEMKVHAETTVENTLSNLKANIAIAEYYLEQDPNNAEWKTALAEAQEAYQLYMDSNPLELECNNIDFIINDQLFTHFTAIFGNELEKAVPLMELEVEDAYYNAFLNGVRHPDEIYEEPIESLMVGLQNYWMYEFDNLDISSAARQNIHDQLADCVPKLSELQTELNEAWEAGNAIPQSVKDGLLDIYTYKAMSSDMTENMEGVTYLIGYELSQSPGFYSMLTKADDLGWFLNKELALGIKSNLSFVESASGDTVDVIKDGITVATLEMTPELRENMKNLGVNLSEGVMEGADEGLVEEDTRNIFQKIGDWFCDLFGIHSPSTVFIAYGEDIVNGLNIGLGSYTDSKSSVTGWSDSIVEWFTKGSDGKNIIDHFREFGEGIIGGFKGEVSADYPTSQSSITTWASKIKQWFTGGSFGGINFTTFGSFARNIISGFTNDTSSNYTTSQSPILTWASKVKDWFTGSSYGGVNSTSFGGFAKTIINAFTNNTSQNYTGSQSSVTTWASKVKEWFTGNSYGAVNATSFGSFASSIITGFKNKVSSNYTGSQSSMTTWASKVKDWFTSGSFGGVNSTSFSTFAGNIITGFKNKIGNSYTTSQSSMTTWASKVKDWFSGTASSSAFSGFASNIISGFKNKIGSNYTDTKPNMETFGSKVKSWFTGTVSYSSFYSVASDVISGFKNGIGNLYSTMKNTITSWGSSIINWFKNKLGINSPSKVFYEMAGYSVEGFNNGFSYLGKTTKGVVNSWADSFTSVTPTMSFAVDTSALRYYDSNSFAKTMSTNVVSTASVTATGFKEGMEEFYREYVEPTMAQMAADMRRQADKPEQTVVQIGNRTVTDAVTTQQRANGYAFAK